ncbi:hypothetical protein KSD_25750 [Ktedonobacter sp. SOSP1-85]|uniref:hypothetical protein n=1 Tax=unclassified Ktedonobacter TaxID=388461 RepID=UPI001916099C|nr:MULTISPECIES: hypothetical protein [unclassified Ktedonobacter]GHO68944.1 hypothetical protein KSC_078360 [Ktedonobacter sp. SOSP1-52]GHO74804.1 hypothetical protein KSD_25750 [Ktedonobacter sp. SOSP1-85]
MDTMQTRREPRPLMYDPAEEDDAIYETRSRTSTRRYRSNPPTRERNTRDDVMIDRKAVPQRRRSGQTREMPMVEVPVRESRDLKRERPKAKKGNPALLIMVIGMACTVLLILGMSTLASWWHVYQDDLHYGRPRTSQFDAVVGHNDSAQNKTHFVIINLNRRIQIIEIPGGDPSKSRMFTGPSLVGAGQDLTPAWGEADKDVNGDGKPDLIVHVLDQQFIFLNDGSTFHQQH